MATEKKQPRIVTVRGRIPAILAQVGITLTLYELAHAHFRFYPDGWNEGALMYGGCITGYEIHEDLVRLFIAPLYVAKELESCLTYYFGAGEKMPAWRFGYVKQSELKRGTLELFV